MFNYNTFSYGFGVNNKWMWDVSGNGVGNTTVGNASYNYNQPNINGQNISGQNINGQNVGGYNMPNYTQVGQTNNQNSQNFNQSQQNQIGAFQGAMQSSVNALPTYEQLNQQNNARYNVDPLMSNATNLNNQLLRIPSENYAMTQGSDTNQGQLDQMSGVQQFRLQPLAQNATAQAQQAQNLSNQATGYGVQNEAFQISPYTTAAPLVQNQMTAAASNFTQQQSDQLAALTAQMNAGVSLSKDQMDQMSALQQAKYVYDAAIATANATQNAAIYGANKLQNVQPGSIMYNPANGKNSPVG